MLNHVLCSPVPDPNTVIYFIFMRVGDGSSIEMENGSWAYYWYGHRYEFKGKRYFTGFVYQTPDRDMSSGDGFFPVPGGEVTIAEATFVEAEEGARKPWNFVGSQPYIGQFGGYERVNIISDEQPPVTFLSRSDDYLLAIPTSYLAGAGVEVRTSEIFLRSRQDDGWKYVGSVVVGVDNDAAFVRGSFPDQADPAFHHSGQLEFVDDPRYSLPLIRVSMRGTDMDERGCVRNLNPDETVEYAFDPERAEYRQVTS